MLSRRRLTAAAVTALVLPLAGPTADAATPVGGTYKGKPVRAFVPRDAKRVTVTLTCGGRSYKLENLRLGQGGRFSGERNQAGARRNPVATVQGRFVSRKRAEGSYRAPGCGDRWRPWRASRR